jgi:hypothetical protein
MPADISANPAPCGIETNMGVVVLLVVPSPSCPNSFHPQHIPLLLSRITQVCPSPASIEIAVLPEGSCGLLGYVELLVVPSPNAP